ncbi:MAG: YitT family protein [Rikenellaceae bacterium]|nr:YitT family protein [Rikenellaceae bacterium]
MAQTGTSNGFWASVANKWRGFHFITKEDLHSAKWWLSWLWIALGTLILALGFVLFMYPYKLTPGGIWGMATVLHELFPSIEIGWFGYMMDIPLLLMAFLVFGPVFGIRTVYASLLTPFWMLVLPYLVYPDPSVQTAQTLLNGVLDLSDHLLLAALVGALFIGVGVGVTVRSGATTGGTDIVSMFMKKYLHTSFGTGILVADVFVVMCSIVVFCLMGGESVIIPIYSIIAIYVAVKVLDYVIEGANDSKLMFVISEQYQPEIERFILDELQRGATYIKSSGMYTKSPKDMIFLVVGKRQLPKVKESLRRIDPTLFMVVVDAHETLGEGFQPLGEE